VGLPLRERELHTNQRIAKHHTHITASSGN
jgi:hypothetical protein